MPNFDSDHTISPPHNAAYPWQWLQSPPPPRTHAHTHTQNAAYLWQWLHRVPNTSPTLSSLVRFCRQRTRSFSSERWMMTSWSLPGVKDTPVTWQHITITSEQRRKMYRKKYHYTCINFGTLWIYLCKKNEKKFPLEKYIDF